MSERLATKNTNGVDYETFLCITHEITCPVYAIVYQKHELCDRNVRLTGTMLQHSK